MKLCPCGGVIDSADVCDRCGPRKVKQSRRGSARERGYDRRWEKWRAWYLAQPGNQLCVACSEEGKTTPARDLHHRLPLQHFPSYKKAEWNILPLCQRCHNKQVDRLPRNSELPGLIARFKREYEMRRAA